MKPWKMPRRITAAWKWSRQHFFELFMGFAIVMAIVGVTLMMISEVVPSLRLTILPVVGGGLTIVGGCIALVGYWLLLR